MLYLFKGIYIHEKSLDLPESSTAYRARTATATTKRESGKGTAV
jgi:hypothetical protein